MSDLSGSRDIIVCILTIISIIPSFCSCVSPPFLAVSVSASPASSSFAALNAVDAFAAAAWTSAGADLKALSKAVVSLLTFVPPPQPSSSNATRRNATVNNWGSFVFIDLLNSGLSAIWSKHSQSDLCYVWRTKAILRTRHGFARRLLATLQSKLAVRSLAVVEDQPQRGKTEAAQHIPN